VRRIGLQCVQEPCEGGLVIGMLLAFDYHLWVIHQHW
jgi:hypothetical protein